MSDAESRPGSWLGAEISTSGTLEGVLALRPELLDRYREFYRSFWDDGLVPHRSLELCRLRIAAIHDCAAEWAIRDPNVMLTDKQLEWLRNGNFDEFTAAERDALAVAEKTPYQHHQVTDAEVEALENAFGPAGAVSLLTAVSFFDVSSRWRLVFGLPASDVQMTEPPLKNGELP